MVLWVTQRRWLRAGLPAPYLTMKRISRAAAALLLCIGAPRVSAQLITNGGFETGVFSPWATTIPCAAVGSVNVFNSPPGIAHSGSFGLRMSSPGTCSAGQSVATTMGSTYTLAFWLQLNVGGTPNQFVANVGPGIASLTFGNVLPFAYALQSLNFVATSTSTLIRFDASNGNPDASWNIDDVSVALSSNAVPEPSSIALTTMGVLAIAAGARRKRQKRT